MNNILTDIEQQTLRQLVDEAHKIVLTCHTNPDGDAMGSLTAMMSVLLRRGHDVVAVAPERWPDNLGWLPLADKVMIYQKNEEAVKAAMADADLLIMLDHGQLSRMNELGDAVAEVKAPRIIIDHHPNPDESLAKVVICQPTFCAAGEVLYRVLSELGWAEDLTHDEAVSIYAAMMTDTGGFTFNSTRSEVYHIIAELLEKGIDKDRIYRNVYYTASADRYRLLGYLLYVKMEIMHEYHAAIMSLTNDERKLFKIKNGETDGMVNQPLMIDGMKLSIFLREDTEKKGTIRMSLRSVDDFPTNEMSAKFFNGGGHRNASGGRLECTMDEAIERVRQAIKSYGDLLKNK